MLPVRRKRRKAKEAEAAAKAQHVESMMSADSDGRIERGECRATVEEGAACGRHLPLSSMRWRKHMPSQPRKRRIKGWRVGGGGRKRGHLNRPDNPKKKHNLFLEHKIASRGLISILGGGDQ